MSDKGRGSRDGGRDDSRGAVDVTEILFQLPLLLADLCTGSNLAAAAAAAVTGASARGAAPSTSSIATAADVTDGPLKGTSSSSSSSGGGAKAAFGVAQLGGLFGGDNNLKEKVLGRGCCLLPAAC